MSNSNSKDEARDNLYNFEQKLRTMVEELRRDPSDWSNSDVADAYNDALDDILAILTDLNPAPKTKEAEPTSGTE